MWLTWMERFAALCEADCLHGPQWVADGRTKDADDLARAMAVQAWITETYA